MVVPDIRVGLGRVDTQSGALWLAHSRRDRLRALCPSTGSGPRACRMAGFFSAVAMTSPGVAEPVSVSLQKSFSEHRNRRSRRRHGLGMPSHGGIGKILGLAWAGCATRMARDFPSQIGVLGPTPELTPARANTAS